VLSPSRAKSENMRRRKSMWGTQAVKGTKREAGGGEMDLSKTALTSTKKMQVIIIRKKRVALGGRLLEKKRNMSFSYFRPINQNRKKEKGELFYRKKGKRGGVRSAGKSWREKRKKEHPTVKKK